MDLRRCVGVTRGPEGRTGGRLSVDVKVSRNRRRKDAPLLMSVGLVQSNFLSPYLIRSCDPHRLRPPIRLRIRSCLHYFASSGKMA